MIRYLNLARHVRRYQWLLGGLLILVALFVLAPPPVPKDLDYRYQLTPATASYPLVAQSAGLVRWSTERVREVYRWNLTAETVALAWPPSKAGTEDAAVPATAMIFLGVAGMVLLWFVPSQRSVGVGLLVVVIFGSLLGANAEAYTRTAAGPSTFIPAATATLVTHAEPGHTLGLRRESKMGLKDLADRYWTHYVTFTQHRMGMAGKLFATPKRIWFGITGLIYVLPFAVLLALLSSLTVLVQTLAWALTMVAAFALAVAIADGRAGLKVWEHVLAPLLASYALLGVLGLTLPLVLYAATAVHAIENEFGLIAIGSIFPLVLTYLVWRYLLRSHLARTPAPGGHQPHHGPPIPPAEGGRLRALVPRRRRAR